MEKSSWPLVTSELSLFQRLYILSSMCTNPLTWCSTHKGQFLNVSFLAKLFFKILRSQIELERVFSLVRVLTIVKHYLQMENLDQIIIVVKNWFDDMCLNCTPNVNLKDYMEAKVVLVKEEYQLIKKLNTSKNCKLTMIK